MKIPGLEYWKRWHDLTSRTWLVAGVVFGFMVVLALTAKASGMFRLLEIKSFDWLSRVALRFPAKVSDRIVVVTVRSFGFKGPPMLDQLDFSNFMKSSRFEQRWLTTTSGVTRSSREPGQAFETRWQLEPLIREKAAAGQQHVVYPVPRAYYGQLVRKLREQGAAAVGFDGVFFWPGPDYPFQIAAPEGFGKASDTYFAEELAAAGNVVLANNNTEPGFAPSYDLFLTNAWATGYSIFDRGMDGRCRGFSGSRKGMFHMDVLLAAKALSLDLTRVRHEGGAMILPGPNGSKLAIPEGETLIHWSIGTNDSVIPRVNFEDVVLGTSKVDFRNKVVLVSRRHVKPEMESEEATPISYKTPSTVMHLNTLNTLLTQQFIRKTSRINFLLIYGPAAIVLALSWRLRGLARAGFAGLMAAGYVGLALWLFVQFRLWIPLVEPMAFLAVASYATLLTPAKSRRELVVEMFRKAGYGRVESAGPGIWQIENDSEQRAIAVIWDAGQRAIPPAITKLAPAPDLGSIQPTFRIYLLFDEIAPPIEMLQSWKHALRSEIIPLRMALVEKAVGGENTVRMLREIEEPYVVRTDPYAEFKPILDPTWFYGREELLQTLPAVLAQGQHLGLFGLRKIGKTSLTNQLRQRSLATPSAFLDCQGLNPKAASYFLEIYRQIHAELSDSIARVRRREIGDGEAFSAAIIELFELWRKGGQHEPFLVIFDEIDRFFPSLEIANRNEILTQYVQVFGVLRSLAQRHSCLAVLAIAYRPYVNRQNMLSAQVGENPMFQSFQEVYLGNLTAGDSAKMLVEIGLWKEIVWVENAALKVFDYCGGHPLITRLFASHACEQGHRKRVELNHVQAAAEEIQRTFRKNDIGNYFKEGIWHLLEEKEQALLERICRAEPDGLEESTVPAELDAALTNLDHFGLVVQHAGRLRIAGSLLECWLERRFAVSHTGLP